MNSKNCAPKDVDDNYCPSPATAPPFTTSARPRGASTAAPARPTRPPPPSDKSGKSPADALRPSDDPSEAKGAGSHGGTVFLVLLGLLGLLVVVFGGWVAYGLLHAVVVVVLQHISIRCPRRDSA